MMHVGPEFVLSLKRVRLLAAPDAAAAPASRAIELVYQAANPPSESPDRQGPEKTVVEPLPDESFPGIFAACERLANRVLAAEFRLNGAVAMHFTPVGEHYIALWHTKGQDYLRCPLQMKVDWSCEYLRRNSSRMFTLGVSEVADDMKLAFDRLPLEKTVEVLVHSMFSGIEFVGTLINTRDRAMRDHDKLVEEGRAAGVGGAAGPHKCLAGAVGKRMRCRKWGDEGDGWRG